MYRLQVTGTAAARRQCELGGSLGSKWNVMAVYADRWTSTTNNSIFVCFVFCFANSLSVFFLVFVCFGL